MTQGCTGDGWYALVADDDDDWRKLASLALRSAGFQVCEACDGEELLARYHALRVLTPRHVVVVSDIAMPGCDGVSATAELRKASADVPILLVTGERSPGVLGAAQDAGASMVLAKPVERGVLVDAVKGLCRV